MTREEFDDIFNRVSSADINIPLPVFVNLLAKIVAMVLKKENTDAFVASAKDYKIEIEDVIPSITITTCNSILISIYNAYKEEIDKSYELNKDEDEETNKKQEA